MADTMIRTWVLRQLSRFWFWIRWRFAKLFGRGYYITSVTKETFRVAGSDIEVTVGNHGFKPGDRVRLKNPRNIRRKQ